MNRPSGSTPQWVDRTVFLAPGQSNQGSLIELKTFKFGTVIDMYMGQPIVFDRSPADILAITPYPSQKGLVSLTPAIAHLCENGAGWVNSLGGYENPRLGVHTFFPNATLVTKPLLVATRSQVLRQWNPKKCDYSVPFGWIARVTSYTNGTYRFKLAVTYKLRGHIYRGLYPPAVNWIIPFNRHFQADGEYCPGPRCGYLTP